MTHERASISERLRSLLASEKAFKFAPDIGDDVSLRDAGVLDSFGLISLVVHVEGEFGIKVVPEDATFDRFRSVRSIAEYIEMKMNADHRR